MDVSDHMTILHLWPEERSSILGVTADLGVPPVCPDCTLDIGVRTNPSHFSNQGGIVSEASLTHVDGLLTPVICLPIPTEPFIY